MRRLGLHQISTAGADATNDTPRFNPATNRLEYAAGGGGGGTGSGGVTLITSIKLAGAAASFNFPNIPTGYAHLRLVVIARTDETGGGTMRSIRAAINGDVTAANYVSYYHQDATELYNNGADGNARLVGLVPTAATASGAPAGHASVTDMTLIDYAGTTFFKTWQSRSSIPGHVDTRDQFVNTTWKNAAAVTSITLTPAVGNFIAGSAAWLYGIAG